jgi:hypothetical protein
MGGFFSPTQTAQPIVQSGGPPASYSPFAQSFVNALGNLFQTPAGGKVTPLEQNTIMQAYQGALGPAAFNANMASGGFLPTLDANGNPTSGNPFMRGLLGQFQQQEDVQNRSLASAAQRAGALNSTDYLTQQRLQNQQMQNNVNATLANMFQGQEALAQQATGTGFNLAQGLLGMAGLPRTVATDATLQPFQMGLQLLGPFSGMSQSQGGQVQTGPSPFASMVSGLTALAGAAAPFFGNRPATPAPVTPAPVTPAPVTPAPNVNPANNSVFNMFGINDI